MNDIYHVPKVPTLEPYHQMVRCHVPIGYYPSAEMQSIYSIHPADKAELELVCKLVRSKMIMTSERENVHEKNFLNVVT